MGDPDLARERLRLIVGLGNPGEKYRETRHNLGFRVLDRLSASNDFSARRLECNALVSRGGDLMLAWPQTYMNRSGYSVRCLQERHELAAENILVVYDDIDLPLGSLRLRGRGGPGGHRGMESVIRNLRSDLVPRLRLGVGPQEELAADVDLSDFVLTEFSSQELDLVEKMIERAASACRSWLADPLETTMNRFNG